jgi:hypothetical protein
VKDVNSTLAKATAALLAIGWIAAPPAAAQRLKPKDRERVLRNYERYQQAPEDKRREVERQYQRWQGMPEDERQKILRNYDRYRALSRDEQREFKRKYEDWRRRQPR